ncbi:MAG: hemerythrin family protein [Marinilabilia sp.]
MNFSKHRIPDIENNLKPDYSEIHIRDKTFEDILNECKLCVERGNALTEKEVEDVIQKLENYLLSHLACEEAVMKRSDYPGLEEHLSQHQVFKDKVRFFRQESHFSREALMTKIYQFSKKWFISHILQMDQAFKNNHYCPENLFNQW